MKMTHRFLVNSVIELQPQGFCHRGGKKEVTGPLAAAKILMDTDMSAEDVAKKSIKVASDICVFTNNNVTIEKL